MISNSNGYKLNNFEKEILTSHVRKFTPIDEICKGVFPQKNEEIVRRKFLKISTDEILCDFLPHCDKETILAKFPANDRNFIKQRIEKILERTPLHLSRMWSQKEELELIDHIIQQTPFDLICELIFPYKNREEVLKKWQKFAEDDTTQNLPRASLSLCKLNVFQKEILLGHVRRLTPINEILETTFSHLNGDAVLRKFFTISLDEMIREFLKHCDKETILAKFSSKNQILIAYRIEKILKQTSQLHQRAWCQKEKEVLLDHVIQQTPFDLICRVIFPYKDKEEVLKKYQKALRNFASITASTQNPTTPPEANPETSSQQKRTKRLRLSSQSLE